MNMRSDYEYESIPNRISYSEIINIIYSQIKKKMNFCTLNKYAMKMTNDILKDYFYDKCSHEEEIEIQKWLTENDNNLMDQSFREIISEIQIRGP